MPSTNITVSGVSSGSGIATLLSPYALTSALASLQPSLTATAPLSITSNGIPINLSSPATTSYVASAVTDNNNLNKVVYQT